MADLKAQLEISADASGVEAGVGHAKRALDGLGTSAAAAGKKAADGLAGIGDGGDAASAKVDRAAKSLIGSIQRTTAAMEAGGRSSADYFRVLADQRGVDRNLLQPYLDQLDAVTAKQRAAGIAVAGTTAPMNQLGVSAAQTAAALRGVPAQMTDIVTSLQGGQRPMTVLLQQGGQLKDMFGGVGNAARAIGGYVLGLINPFTILAGVLGVVGYAYMQGTKENEAYSRALILTGNAAGTTVGQLQGLAASVSRATGATQGAAAEVLAAFASNGNIANAQLEKFAGTAIRLEREAGIAVADTVKQFAELAKDPVDASVKLNESTRHLTVSVYDQIKALADQGRTADAAAVAMKAYADSMDERAGKLQANLGYVEQAWRLVTGAAKDAWDAMLGVGRAQSSTEQLNDLAGKIQAKETEINRISGMQANSDFGRQQKAERLANLAKELASFQAQSAAINGVVTAKQLSADADAAAAKSAQSKAEFDKRGLAFLTDQQKFQKAWNLEVAEGKRLMAAGAITAEQYYNRLLAVEKQFAGKGTKAPAIKADAFLGDVTKSYLDAIKDLAKIQSDGSAAADGLSKSQARLRDVMGSPEFAAFSRQQREQLIYAASLSQAEEDRQAAMKASAESQKELAKTMADYAKATEDATIAARKAVQDAQTEYDNYGLLKSQIAQLTLARLEDARASAALGGEDTSGIEARIEAQKRLIAILQSGEAREAGEKAAKAAAEEWKKTADQINQSLTDALLRGFESGKDFATNFRDTLVNMFKTLVLRPIISAVVNPVAQGITGALGLSTVASAATGASAASNTGLLAGVGAATAGFGQAAGATISNGLVSGFGVNMGNIGALASGGSYMTALGAAMPYIGVALALGSLFSGGGFKSSASTGDAGATFDALGQRTSSTDLSKYNYAALNSSFAEKVVADLQSNYAATAKGLGIGLAATSFGYSGNTGAQGENPQFNLGGGVAGGNMFNSGEVGASDASLTLAASRAVFAALQGSTLPTYLAGVFDNITASTASQEQITATLATAQAFKALHDQLLAMPLPELKDISYATASALVAAAGGMDAFTSKLSTYYDKFYSDNEKTAQLTETVGKALGELGIKMPKLGDGAREAFRALVQSQDLSTASGQKAYATLIGVSGAFDQLATSAAAVQSTIDNVVTGVKDSVDKSIFDMQYGLADNAGKYNMLDVKGAGLDQQLRSSTDITEIGKIAQQEIALLNQAFALLSTDQQKGAALAFENKLTSIEEFVTAKGADARGQAQAQADTIAAAVEAAITRAMATSAQQLADAAASIQAAANTPAVANIAVTVSKPAGVEVAIQDYSAGGRG